MLPLEAAEVIHRQHVMEEDAQKDGATIVIARSGAMLLQQIIRGIVSAIAVLARATALVSAILLSEATIPAEVEAIVAAR